MGAGFLQNLSTDGLLMLPMAIFVFVGVIDKISGHGRNTARLFSDMKKGSK